jgi:hypothetical protein
MPHSTRARWYSGRQLVMVPGLLVEVFAEVLHVLDQFRGVG